MSVGKVKLTYEQKKKKHSITYIIFMFQVSNYL